MNEVNAPPIGHVTLRIERVVIEGFAPGRPERLLAVLERALAEELAVYLTTGRLPEGWAEGSVRLDAGIVSLPPAADEEAFAHAVAGVLLPRLATKAEA